MASHSMCVERTVIRGYCRLAPGLRKQQIYICGRHTGPVLCSCCAHSVGGCADEKRRILRNIGWIIASGLCLAIDFAFWVWGLKYTSLSHSLFLSSSAPPVLALGSLIIGVPISCGKPCILGWPYLYQMLPWDAVAMSSRRRLLLHAPYVFLNVSACSHTFQSLHQV